MLQSLDGVIRTWNVLENYYLPQRHFKGLEKCYGAGGVVLEVEHLPSKCTALVQTPVPPEKKFYVLTVHRMSLERFTKAC
jgi:hypothetical protein